MSELRQRMIDQMTLRRFSPRTHESYLEAVTGLARYYKQSPDQLSAEQIRQYLLYLERERHLAWSSLNVAASGLRFLYFDTLKWQPVKLEIPPRRYPSTSAGGSQPRGIRPADIRDSQSEASDNVDDHLRRGVTRGRYRQRPA
jgi:hypothetical protein